MSKHKGVVLITGASSGLGLELARLFAAKGCNLFVLARRMDRLQKLKEELESQFDIDVSPIAADLSDPESPQKVFNTIKAVNGQIDILINNAGMGLYGEFAHLDFSKIAHMYQVNVLSVLHLTRLFLPLMLKRNQGHVINVASLGAFFPGPLMSVYFAAKADLFSFAAALNYELRGSGITISTVCPGPFKSEFQQTAFGVDRNQHREDRLPSCSIIARTIFADLVKRKTIIVPGVRHQIIYRLCRWIPQSWILRLVYKEQERLRFNPIKNEVDQPACCS